MGWQLRVYRLVLLFYPASFRADYEDELCRVFTEELRELDSIATWWFFWATTLNDTIRSAFAMQLDMSRQDVTYCIKSLNRARGFTSAAVLITALGIGASTAVFSLADYVLLRPLPFERPETLVRLWESVPRYNRMELSPPNYRDWKRLSTAFDAMGAFHSMSVNLADEGDPQRLDAIAVSLEIFPILAVQPFRGRWFEPDHHESGQPPAVMLSHGLWQSSFGGAESVVGRLLRLNDMNHEVVGVMPAGFYFPDRDTSVWVAKQFRPEDFEDRDNNFLQGLARLAPGISLVEARSEMTVIAEQLEREYPVANEKTGATVVRLRDRVPKQSRLLLLALSGAVVCLLLIACTNLAGLLLARGTTRRREMVVRSVLGAGRERLARQLLTESGLLAVLGGCAGVVVATLLLPMLVRLVPASLPIGVPVVADVRVMGFAIVLSVVVGGFFGMFPMMSTSEPALDLGRERGPARKHRRLRSVMVALQIATSIVLLVCSGLLVRALWAVQSVDPGFNADGVLTLRTALPTTRYAKTSERARFYARVLERVRELASVRGAAYISFLPMVMRGGIWPVEVSGFQEETTAHTASLRFVTPGFFQVLGIDLELGRDVRQTDHDQPPFVAVVSRSFAERYWPGRDPIGSNFEFAFRERVVVGVVNDIRVRGLERASEPQVYLPHQQVPDGGLVFYAPKDLVVLTDGDPDQIVPMVRDIVRSVDPSIPVSDVRPLSDIVAGETGPRRSQIRVLAVFSMISMLLAGIGLYGLLSYVVSQRTSEIGLRLALGARRRMIVARVLRDGLLLAAAGGGVGLGAAYLAGHSMRALLVDVQPVDATTYATTLGLVLAVTLAGSILPATHAARIDPRRALELE